VIALERHIEILLLENDCVIVPDLGGFMAHYVEASYDGSEQLYLPPLRTLGFNPKLKMNDSLLAQSYVESYDISYPEAVTRIEKEVSEIKQQIENQGLYEIYDIGTLRLNKEGNYEFEPCEAGILTPGLYGLSALEISPIAQAPAISHKSAIVSTDAKEPTAHTPLEKEEKQEKGERALHIKMSTVRKAVAAAAAVALLIVLAFPMGNESKSIIEKCMIDTDLFYRIMPKEITTNKPSELRSKKEEVISKKDDVSLREEEVKKEDVHQPSTINHTTSEGTHQPSTINHPTSEGTHQPSTINHQPSGSWTIVLASQVARKNAEAFVGKLKERGYTETEILQRAKGIKVVLGRFENEAQAQNRLRSLRQESADFAEAWTMKIDN